MRKIEFRAMGSQILAILDSEATLASVAEVPRWFEGWEQVLSRFRLDSELSQLNARAGQVCQVSPDLWSVVETAIEAAELTDGLVNPLVLEAVVAAGYDRSFEAIRDGQSGSDELTTIRGEASFGLARPMPAPASIVRDAERRLLQIPKAAGLDFGGVAKGWAAQRAMELLGAEGPALVSAGGDIAVSGPHASGEPWSIGVEDPANRQHHLEVLFVDKGGVATSGKDHRHWQRQGTFQHHIIDPRTMEPAVTDVTAVTVVASTVMRAEALAKAVLISGSGSGLELLECQPDAEAVIILDSGKLLYSRGIETYL